MDMEKEPNKPREVISRVDRLGVKDKGADTPNSDKSNWDEPKNSGAFKWIFRLLIVPILCILVTFGGMVAGFVALGKGTVDEALQMETWKHLFQLVFG